MVPIPSPSFVSKSWSRPLFCLTRHVQSRSICPLDTFCVGPITTRCSYNRSYRWMWSGRLLIVATVIFCHGITTHHSTSRDSSLVAIACLVLRCITCDVVHCEVHVYPYFLGCHLSGIVNTYQSDTFQTTTAVRWLLWKWLPMEWFVADLMRNL